MKLETLIFTDSSGRKIKLSELDGRRKLTLIEVTGNHPQNFTLFAVVNTLLHVVAIDDEILKTPYTIEDVAEIYNLFLDQTFNELQPEIANLQRQSLKLH